MGNKGSDSAFKENIHPNPLRSRSVISLTSLYESNGRQDFVVGPIIRLEELKEDVSLLIGDFSKRQRVDEFLRDSNSKLMVLDNSTISTGLTI